MLYQALGHFGLNALNKIELNISLEREFIRVRFILDRQNISISPLNEQFSRNDSAQALQWLQKQISNF